MCVIVARVLLVLCCSHFAGSGGVKTAGWAAAAGMRSGCSWCCLIPARDNNRSTSTSSRRQTYKIKGQCVGCFWPLRSFPWQPPPSLLLFPLSSEENLEWWGNYKIIRCRARNANIRLWSDANIPTHGNESGDSGTCRYVCHACHACHVKLSLEISLLFLQYIWKCQKWRIAPLQLILFCRHQLHILKSNSTMS